MGLTVNLYLPKLCMVLFIQTDTPICILKHLVVYNYLSFVHNDKEVRPACWINKLLYMLYIYRNLLQNSCNATRYIIPGNNATILQIFQLQHQYNTVTVEPPLTDTPNSGHLRYNGQQSMYRLRFPYMQNITAPEQRTTYEFRNNTFPQQCTSNSGLMGGALVGGTQIRQRRVLAGQQRPCSREAEARERRSAAYDMHKRRHKTVNISKLRPLCRWYMHEKFTSCSLVYFASSHLYIQILCYSLCQDERLGLYNIYIKSVVGRQM